MTIEPIGDQVVVELLESKEERLASGIFVSKDTLNQTREGLVVAVGKGAFGEGATRQPMTVRVEDRVLLDHCGVEARVDGRTYYILHEDQILAVLRE